MEKGRVGDSGADPGRASPNRVRPLWPDGFQAGASPTDSRWETYAGGLRLACAAQASVHLVDAELVEEYLVPHFRVAEQLCPANHFHVEADVAEPIEPSKAVGHRGKVLLLLEPVLDLFGEVAATPAR